MVRRVRINSGKGVGECIGIRNGKIVDDSEDINNNDNARGIHLTSITSLKGLKSCADLVHMVLRTFLNTSNTSLEGPLKSCVGGGMEFVHSFFDVAKLLIEPILPLSELGVW